MKKITGEIVLKYLDKFTNTPSLTLAKLIYKENHEAFNSVEHVRSTIRTYRGTKGGNSRESVKNRKFFGTTPDVNMFKVPDSEAEDYAPFTLPKQYKRIAVLSDIHVPYHDVEALNVAIKHCKESKCDAVFLNGDIIDFYLLSRFVKDPRVRRIDEELESLAVIIKILQDNIGKVYYKLGNHEERLELYMRVKAPELIGVVDYEISTLLLRHNVRIETIYRQMVMLGSLPVLHGHEFMRGGSLSVNPARGLFLKANRSSVVGHHHRTSQHSEMDLIDKLVTTWSFGCLCGLHPEYAQINKWNHGFGIVNILDDEGTFDFENFRIYRNKIYQ